MTTFLRFRHAILSLATVGLAAAHGIPSHQHAVLFGALVVLTVIATALDILAE